jgi:hypothetical protein
VPAARSSASDVRRRPSFSPMVLSYSSQWPSSVFVTDGAPPVFIQGWSLRRTCVNLGGPPACWCAAGSTSRAMRSTHTIVSVRPPGVAIIGDISSVVLNRLLHLCVLLLRSHHVVGILPVRDLSDTIHPSFSSRRHCKGVQS